MNFLLSDMPALLTAVTTVTGVPGAFINAIITSTTSNIYSLIEKIQATPPSDVTELISSLDIEVTLRVFELFLLEINKPTDSQKVCLQEIHSVILSIKEELEKIHFRMNYNSDLYFLSSIRSYRFTNCIIRLKIISPSLNEDGDY